MSDRAHIIDIDNLVLTGVDLRHPARLSALIAAEVQRVLGGSDLPAATGITNSEMGVASEVARTVVRSLPGGSDRV
ncbi:MAG: hypothetical protein HY268_03480 [Deltaproteobacteria bacterium]|nr:hypothetical protein [Deltaproteobacteria bacterium]